MQMLIEEWPVGKLIEYARNPRKNDHAVAKIAAAIHEFGFRVPVLAKSDGLIIDGHLRLKAARNLGMETVPVLLADDMSDNQIKAFRLSINKMADLAEWDVELLRLEFEDFQELGLDLSLTGFSEEEIDDLLADPGEERQKNMGGMAEQFLVAPFSVLNAREGWWQERKSDWLKITGDLTETKAAVLGSGELMRSINDGSSNFDPTLAELMMRWFSPVGGKVLDPFGGEQTKGVVAGVLERQYYACEFRADQVAVNRAACADYPDVHYVCGDSEAIDEKITERGFDLCFTSPPYYDLEVYSKDDMSGMGTYDDFMAKYERIFAKCVAMMDENSFLAIKIGEIRDKKTGIYRNFLGDNIAIFLRLGLKYYNEMVLVTMVGTLPVRAGKSFAAARKIGKTHQNILVFVKGDPVLASRKCGDPMIPDVVFPQPQDEGFMTCPACGHQWVRGMEVDDS